MLSTNYQNWSLLIRPDEIQDLIWNSSCILQVNSQLISMHDGSTTHELQLTGQSPLLKHIDQFFPWPFTHEME